MRSIFSAHFKQSDVLALVAHVVTHLCITQLGAEGGLCPIQRLEVFHFNNQQSVRSSRSIPVNFWDSEKFSTYSSPKILAIKHKNVQWQKRQPQQQHYFCNCYYKVIWHGYHHQKLSKCSHCYNVGLKIMSTNTKKIKIITTTKI